MRKLVDSRAQNTCHMNTYQCFFLSISIQLPIRQPFYMILIWLKSILYDINYSNSIFGWCFLVGFFSLSLFSFRVFFVWYHWDVMFGSIKKYNKLSMKINVWLKYKCLILNYRSCWQINYSIRINGCACNKRINRVLEVKNESCEIDIYQFTWLK